MQEPVESERKSGWVLWRLARGLAAAGIVVGIVAAIAVIWIIIGPYGKWVDGVASASTEIVLVEDTLNQTSAALDQLVQTMQTTSDSMVEIETGVDDLDGLLQSVGDFLSDEAPETIESARAAILSTQEGARAMDRVLRGLASVSFLTGVEYDPEQPLDASLAEVAESLSPLPDSLRQVSGDLEDVQSNLDQLQEAMIAMQADLSGLRVELENTSGSLRQNAESAGHLADQAEMLASRLQRLRFVIGLGLFFLTINFCVIQWVVWQIASQHANLDASLEKTQPTRTGE